MHHERFVEAITVQLPRTAILHMDHRRLAECRQQFVGGMGGEHQRAVGRARGAHAVTPGEELVKGRIGVPGFVEVQDLDTVAQGLLDQFGVVAEAVVGRVGDHRQFHFGGTTLGQRAGIDLGLDRLGTELTQGDRPDDPQFIAFRAQVQGNRPGHDDRMQHGLVAVAVHQHQVVPGHHRLPDDLVGGRGAIDHEKRMIGAEIARRTGFRFRQRPGVVQQ
ncbi:hypothetical protein D3C84_524580 [compost metagenome]